MSLITDEIKNHLSKDAQLKTLIDTIPTPRFMMSRAILSHSLIESITYQQLSIKAAAVIFDRLLSKFENRQIDLAKLARMRTTTLRGVGLSFQKADYVRNIANFFLAKENQVVDWHSLPEDELIKRLTVIKGVGVWTVQMIMISPMAKLDVFPHQDLGIQQGMINLYGIKKSGKELITKMNKLSEPWKPYRTVACLYLWRWKDGK